MYMNKPNLRNEEKGWLIFGIDYASRQAIGTYCRPESERL